MTGNAVAPAENYRAKLLDAVRTIERLKAMLDDRAARQAAEPIAVVGLACRMPGGGNDPDAFWRLLRDGVDATGEFPAGRADARAWFHADPEVPGKAYTIRGGFLDQVDRFEPAVFGISPREAVGMDPQQRLALEVAWEALEFAGYAPTGLIDSATGVFLGVSTTDYVRMRQAQGDAEDIDAYQLVGEPSFVAGRISYTLGLRGPCKVIDTTCSSSLVAVHDACRALRSGDCDMALAGGVNLMLSPYGFVLMSKFRALSPDGRCRTFDAGADGYARGEGVGMVVLKRLSDAQAANDNVLAVVRGTAVNHDGRSSGLTVPNPAAQQEVMAAALADAGIPPGHVDYVEAHGTGTSLGDPIELRSVQQVLGRHRPADDPLVIGSVKTNIGHLEPAAGIAGLIKVILALRNREIPPHLHFNQPNPNIDWSALRLSVPTRLRPWPAGDHPRAAAVSSFGVSGTNAHAVVAEAPARGDRAARTARRPVNVLTLSARTGPALRELAAGYARHFRAHGEVGLGDACYTTHVGRAQAAHGVAVAGDSVERLAEVLDTVAGGARHDDAVAATLAPHRGRRMAWLFTGQGSQYAGMAGGLRDEPAFAEAIEACAAVMDPLLDRPLRALLETADDALLAETRHTQPALFAVEYALARTWLSWGLRPAALLGHSLGEIVAACVAGALDLPDAARLAVERGRLMSELPGDGVMATVVCDERRAREAIAEHPGSVSVAAVNGPSDTVISGRREHVAAITERLAAHGVKHRLLRVSHAFHSPLLKPVLAPLARMLAGVEVRAPGIPLVSNVTGRFWTDQEATPEYWLRHTEQAVRFQDGLRALHADGIRTYLEVGPAPVLLGLGSRCVDDPDCTWVPSLRQGRDDRTLVALALGTLHLRGHQVDWPAFHRVEEVRRIPLPTTPWHGESYWFPEARQRPEAAGAATGQPVPGIGRRLRTATPTYELDLAATRWTTGPAGEGRHLSLGGVAELALAAATDALGGRWAGLHEVSPDTPIPLRDEPDGPAYTVHLTVEDRGDGTALIEFRGLAAAEEASGAPWRHHLRCVAHRRPTPAATGADGGGPHVEAAPPLALAPVAADHWATALDAAVAAVAGAAGVDAAPGAGVGVLACERPDLIRSVRAVAERGETGIVGQAAFYAEDGTRLGGARDLRVGDGSRQPSEPAPWYHPDTLLSRIEWHRADPADPFPARPFPASGALVNGDCLLIADAGGVADRLAGVLRAQGARCLVAPPPAAGEVEKLVERWRAESAGGGRLIVCTGLDAPAPEHTDPAALRATRDHAELLTVALVRAVSDRPDCEGVTLTLLTRGAVATGAEARPRVAGSTLWGLGRVIALEHPELWGGAIDLDPDTEPDADPDSEPDADPRQPDADPRQPGAAESGELGKPEQAGETAIAALAAALAVTAKEDQQALRGPDRLVARLVTRAPEPGELARRPVLRRDGSYLVTGAFGGIGTVLARWLAEQGAGRLVLVGRGTLPDRSGRHAADLDERTAARVRLVRELEGLGALVEVVSADVTDPAAVRRAVAAADTAGHPLRGVAHAAGTSLPQFLRDVRAEEYDEVWRPKVLGGWNLHTATAPLALDFFLGFSSIASVWGSQHLASYSAANAFLDQLAFHRRSVGLTALTVNWGPWDLPSNLFGQDVMDFLKATGLRPLAAPQCLRLLGALLAGDHTQQVVCSADWARYKAVMEARADRPLLALVDTAPAAASDGPASGTRTAMLALPADQRRPAIDRWLREQLAQILRIDIAELAGEFHLLEMGLDSLMVMELITRCRADLGLDFKSKDFFACDANLWADFLRRLLDEPAG